MKRVLFMAAIAAAIAASGAELKDLKLKAKTDKENPIDYKVGETIRFDFFLDGVAELPSEAKEPLYVIKAMTASRSSARTGFRSRRAVRWRRVCPFRA